MVKHKAVYFNVEPLVMIYYNILDSLATLNEMFPVLARSQQDAHSFGEISARFFFLNLGEM